MKTPYPIIVVLRVCLVVLIGEVSIMITIDGLLKPAYQQHIPLYLWSVLDAVLLVGFVSPSLFWLVLKPMKKQNKLLHEQYFKIEKIAYLDELTGLQNRRKLHETISREIARNDRNNLSTCIGIIDLDGFKKINDSFGHQVGDSVLLEVTRRLNSSLRKEDSIFRIGGDEFVILLVDIDSDLKIKTTLNRVLKDLQAPFELDNSSLIPISGSIGYTTYPSDLSDSHILLRHADQAMYFSKQKGKNLVTQFDLEDHNHKIHKSIRIARIEQALINHEFCLHFQPKLHIQKQEVNGLEALIRWNDPEKGLVLPNDFLPYTEDNDLSIRIGDWVIEEVFKTLEKLNCSGTYLQISMNVSARQLQDNNFSKKFHQCILKYPAVNPANLELEILESAAFEDIDFVSKQILDCKHLGIKVALDDFGTGYCSLKYIKKFSFDTIKIDRSFISDFDTDRDNSEIVQSILTLAKAFNSQTVAEGVESLKVLDKLKILGCDVAQGYAIARPMPLEQFHAWYNEFYFKEATLSE